MLFVKEYQCITKNNDQVSLKVRSHAIREVRCGASRCSSMRHRNNAKQRIRCERTLSLYLHSISKATVQWKTPVGDARSRSWCPEPLFLPLLSHPVTIHP